MTILTDTTGYNYWKEVTNKHTLEIGPLEGHYTEQMLKHNPASFTVIEPYINSCEVLKQKYPNITVINDDAHYALNKEYDVVVLLGVLYHLASPLHLLEQIVNICKPSTILLDIIGYNYKQDEVRIYEEPLNTKGYRFSKGKVCGYSLTLGENIIINSMLNMGYVSVESYEYNHVKCIHKFKLK